MDVPFPWRREFDAARDPYTARVALGITSTGGGPAYTDEQAQDATAAAFAAGTHIAITVTYNDAANSFSLANIDRGSTAVATHEAAPDPHPQYLTTAEGTAAYQPLDADLTSIAGYGGTNAWLYRSAANTWSAVTVGTGLAFSGGTLTATGTSGAITAVVIQKFTSSGSYVPSSGMKFCIIECVGGGGAGGGCNGAASLVCCGSGGGAGGYSRKLASAADIGASKPVTIGAGGLPAAYAVGGTGGDTSVGSLCIAKGGLGGRPTPTEVGPPGGDGAPTGTGDVVAGGAPGEHGFYSTVAAYITSGAGGSSVFGGGGLPGGTPTSVGNTGWDGNPGKNYGSGGGGATTNNYALSMSGGAGSAGIVIITEYI